MVKTGVWEDEEFIETHSVEDRFMLLYLLTCPNRHVSGVVKVSFRIMTSHLGWDKQQIQIVLERLEKCGDIVVDGSYIWIKAYFDHNSFPGPTLFKQMKSRLDEVPKTMFSKWLEDASERGIPVDKIGYGDPIDRVSVNTNNNTKDITNNNHNYNNNQNDKQSEGKTGSVSSGNGDLVFSKSLDQRLVPSIKKSLLGNPDAQHILDELAAGLESQVIKNPELWVSAVINRGLKRTGAGLKKEDQRLARK